MPVTKGLARRVGLLANKVSGGNSADWNVQLAGVGTGSLGKVVVDGEESIERENARKQWRYKYPSLPGAQPSFPNAELWSPAGWYIMALLFPRMLLPPADCLDLSCIQSTII